ncbi:MAG: hypothetical protein ACYC8T_13970 [Myxococcaceae bacterium]
MAPYRTVVLMFGAFLAIVAVSAAVLFASKLGLHPAAVSDYYRGSEASFIQPKSLAGLLKVAVPHLLAAPLALFVTLHLVGWVGRVRRRPFVVLSALSFGAVLAGITAGFAVRFVHPHFALLKLAAFLGLEATLLVWLGLLAVAAWPARSAGDAGAAPERGLTLSRADRKTLHLPCGPRTEGDEVELP